MLRKLLCMHRTQALLAAALLGVAAIVPLPARAADPFQMISVDEVSKLVGQPGVHVFDANTRETFAEGRIPGAVFVEQITKQLPKEKDATLVFYCRNPK